MILSKNYKKKFKDDLFLISTLLPIFISISLILTNVKNPNELFKIKDKKEKQKNKKLATIKELNNAENTIKEMPQSNLLQSLNPPSMQGTSLSSLSAGLVSSGNAKDSSINVNQGNVSSGEMVNQTGGENRKARTSNIVEPKYPQSAQARGLSGYVILDIALNERGQILSIKILTSTPPNVFDNAAIEAVQKWTFEPEVQNGKAIATTLRQKVNFELD